MGWSWRSRIACSTSAPSTTSRPGPPSCSSRCSGKSPRSTRASLLGFDGHGSTRGALRAQRQLDAQDAVLVGGPGLLRDRVGVQLDDAPEAARLDLDLLVHAPLRLLDRARAADQQVAPDDLQPDAVEPDAGQVGLHDRLRWVSAVVDVHARREPGLAAPTEPPPLAPDVPEQLVHLAPHALEIDQQVPLACHGPTLGSPGSHLVDGALASDVHLPAERLGALPV